MIKKLLIILSTSFFLVGCALFSETTMDDKIARMEAAYSAVVQTLIEVRKPCVDDDPENDALCLIDDELYIKVDTYVDAADDALDKAKLYADLNDDDQARTWLDTFIDQFSKLKKISDLVRGS